MGSPPAPQIPASRAVGTTYESSGPRPVTGTPTTELR